MTEEADIRWGRHGVFLMHVHLVSISKYRRKIFDLNSTENLCSYFANICTDFDVELVEMDSECDHEHLLINSLKGISSRLLRRDRPDIAQRYDYKVAL